MAKIKLMDILDEARIIPTSMTSFANTKHPALYNFVRANKIKLLQTIKTEEEESWGANDKYSFDEQTGIRDFNDTVVLNENSWPFIDDQNEYPNGQEIVIENPEDSDCKGILISNMDDTIYSKLTSGVGVSPLPGFKGLYYGIISC
jgi:hypothetical protein